MTTGEESFHETARLATVMKGYAPLTEWVKPKTYQDTTRTDEQIPML